MIERIGEYEVLERLGEGLFKARRRDSQTPVVLKVLPGWKQSEEALARFQREVRLERAIEHDNVARFLALGKARCDDPELGGDDGTVLYFVREFVDGHSLRQLVAERPPPLALAVSICIQVARGLGAIHQQGVVHRNLNEGNVILDAHGTAKLVDFGLVKLLRDEASKGKGFQTRAGLALGTAGYMSPEQFQGKAIDSRSDLYALGALLYTLICSRPPFPVDNLLEHFHALAHERPAPPSASRASVPAALDEVVMRLLAKAPEERYASAAEVETALLGCLEAPGI